jgi:2-methylcitrate dehydratase PrpD
MVNEELKKLVKKITLVEKETYNKLFPDKLPSSVTINSSENSYKKEVLTAPWGANCQPTDDELLAKFQMQAGVRYRHIWDAIMSENGLPIID